jgi:AcrR family transcriptional regulator
VPAGRVPQTQDKAPRRAVREEHRLLTQRRILASALEIFERQGYSNATVEDIVAAASIARGTFYLHFRSKLDVVKALSQDLTPELIQLYQDLDNLVTGSSSVAREDLRVWMTRAVAWFEEHSTMAIVWQEVSVIEPELWPKAQQSAARLRIVLLIQQLARGFLVTRTRQPAGEIDSGALVDVLCDIWTDALYPRSTVKTRPRSR